jgi:hypothetical protein
LQHPHSERVRIFVVKPRSRSRASRRNIIAGAE